MTQLDLNFTPKLSPQCQKLYDRLRQGPMTNYEMRDELRLLSYTRRMTDLKEAGIAWQKEYRGDGIFVYSLRTN
jgi:hypothetical protein